MVKVWQADIPEKSIVLDYLKPIDYSDSFKMKLPDTCYAGIDELSKELFDITPSWVKGLMKLRNILVKPFGLKPGKGKHSGGDLKPKDRTGLFTVIKKTLNEIVMGEQDKHLDFCVSLYLENEHDGRYITVTTIVKYNNWFGRFYFMFVRPFHKIIVPAGMKHNMERF